MFHNVYGTPTDFGERSQVIPALIRKAVNYPNEEFVVWGSGEQGRAFIHVNDIVNALVLALDKGWGHGWIQIGPSFCTSIKEIALNGFSDCLKSRRDYGEGMSLAVLST